MESNKINIMQYTKKESINLTIDTLHQLILSIKPKVLVKEQPGFRSTNYLIGNSMKDLVCYIICYDQKANLGFTQGVRLAKKFPELKGTGKSHRHLTIDSELIKDLPSLTKLIQEAFVIQDQK